MDAISITQVDMDSVDQLQQVASLLFGTVDSWEWNIANNTALFDGYHVAAIQGGRLVAYADCLSDGSLAQFAGD